MPTLLDKQTYHFFAGESSAFAQVVNDFNDFIKRREEIKKQKASFGQLFEKKNQIFTAFSLLFVLFLPKLSLLLPISLFTLSAYFYLNRKEKSLEDAKNTNNKMLTTAFEKLFSKKETQMELLFNVRLLKEQLEKHLPQSINLVEVNKHYLNLEKKFLGEEINLHLDYLIPELFGAQEELLKEYKKLAFREEQEKYYQSHIQETEREMNGLDYRL